MFKAGGGREEHATKEHMRRLLERQENDQGEVRNPGRRGMKVVVKDAHAAEAPAFGLLREMSSLRRSELEELENGRQGSRVK